MKWSEVLYFWKPVNKKAINAPSGLSIKYINDQPFYIEANALILEATKLKKTDINKSIELIERASLIFERNKYNNNSLLEKLAAYQAIAGRINEAICIVKKIIIKAELEIDPSLGMLAYNRLRIIHKNTNSSQEIAVTVVMYWISEMYLQKNLNEDYEWYASNEAKEKLSKELVKLTQLYHEYSEFFQSISLKMPLYQPTIMEKSIRNII